MEAYISKKAKLENEEDADVAPIQSQVSIKPVADDDDDEVTVAPLRKPPGGPNVKIEDLPDCILPSQMNSGKYQDYLWVLTENGKKEAVEMICTSGNSKAIA